MGAGDGKDGLLFTVSRRSSRSEVVPSPQVIVAVKLEVVASGLASVNVATVAVTALPSMALTGVPLAVSAASATVAVLVDARRAAAVVLDRHADGSVLSSV